MLCSNLVSIHLLCPRKQLDQKFQFLISLRVIVPTSTLNLLVLDISLAIIGDIKDDNSKIDYFSSIFNVTPIWLTYLRSLESLEISIYALFPFNLFCLIIFQK